MRRIGVIQARTGSSRLPGKVLTDLGGMPVLQWVIRAAQAAERLDAVVVATTAHESDDPVAELAARLGTEVVRGDEDDVLNRYVQALDEHPADVVVRITSDCPLLDPHLVDAVVGAWEAAPEHDYVSTVIHRTLPRGLDIELVTADCLRRVHATAKGYDRTHVTSAIYTHPDEYRLLGLVVSPASNDLRVTLDTPEDLAALRDLVWNLPARATRPPQWREVVALLRLRPDLVGINAGVRQKALAEG